MKARFEARDYTGANPRYGFCLLYGTDTDLIEERCAEITRLVAGSLDDPFGVATLTVEDHASLAAEVAAQSLAGGRRVVRVRDCGDRLVPALSRVAAAGTGRTAVVLLAGGLTKRSKLRTWAEQTDSVAAVLCSGDDAGQRRSTVDQALAQAGLVASGDVKGLLLERLPQGRRAIAAEVEKLRLLSGAGDLSWDDASALLDGGEGGTVHAAIDAALNGEASAALSQWERAFEGGASGVGFVRVLGSELGRLAALLADIQGGAAVQEALQRQRLYPRDPRSRRWAGILQRWSAPDMPAALAQVYQAELACKTTGADERLVVSRLLSGVASRGRRRVSRAT